MRSVDWREGFVSMAWVGVGEVGGVGRLGLREGGRERKVG